MYFTNWDEFFEAAEKLYHSNPTGSRYSMKYNHKQAKFVLKVTDDKVTLKFKSDQQQDLKRLEKLNALFFKLMTASPGTFPPSASSATTSTPAK